MQRTGASKLLQRGAQIKPLPSRPTPIFFHRIIRPSTRTLQVVPRAVRPFSTTIAPRKGLSPESEDPQPRVPESSTSSAAPVELTVEEYNQLSDEYMDAIVEKLEALQEDREDVDVEYSAGVLTLSFPPIGTYVINKQPPNKQIWLSSPISGPKRYDYVILGEGQDSKQGTGAGSWVYLRDMSTLQDLLQSEIGVNLSDAYAPASPSGEESV